MTTSLYQTFGKLRFPTTAASITDGLQPLDPARDGLLNLFRDALNAELGAAWTAALTAADSTQLGVNPVTDIIPALPSAEYVTQRKIAWPALFLARDLADTRNRIEENSLWQRRLIQIWGLHYIMPALAIGDRRKFEDILINVVAVTSLCIKNMMHPAHQSGRFLMADLGLSTLDLLTYRAGLAQFEEGTQNAPTYLAMSMALQTHELSGHVEGSETVFTDMKLRAGTGQADGLIPVIVEGDTAVPFP